MIDSIKDQIEQEAYQFYEQHTGITLARHPDGSIVSQGHNDALDAFRHAYTSGRVAQLAGDAISEYFGNHNEIGSGHPNEPNEHRMDLWNNEVGRRAGSETNSKEELAERLAQELGGGDLIESLDDPRLQDLYADDPRLELPENDSKRNILSEDDVKKINDDIESALDGSQDPEEDESLFDKDTFGDFINDVQDFFEQAAQAIIRLRRDPLVLDLDGDGLELTALDGSNVKFDLDANGFAETASWVASDDGFLVFDRNGNGSIDNGTELFGDHTPIDDGNAIATDGFSALSDLDSNGDGIIDASDQQFSDLKIWQDTNQDGQSDVTELSSLADLGIANISLSANNSSQVINGNSVTKVSTFTRSDGSTGEIGNVSLQRDQINSEFVGDYQLTLDALLIPLARGYGNVADLHIAASQNADLLALVQNFSSIDLDGSSGSFSSLVETIIFEWTGTADVAPNSRGTVFDARKLEALEAFLAADFVNTMGNGSPVAANVPNLNNSWNSLVNHVLATLAVQSFGSDIYNFASYSFNTDTISVSEDLDTIVADLKANQPEDTSDAAAYWLNNYRILNALADSFTSDVGSTISSALEGTALEILIGKLGKEHVGGSADDDVLASNGSNSIVTAGAGNDSVTGSNGAIIFGGEGNDTLKSTSGNSTLDGGAGNDTLVGYYNGNNTLLGGDGDDVLKLDSERSGSQYRSNTFEGGTGNDTLTGSASSDTYIFNLGDGQDVISDYDIGSGKQDKIVLGEGIAASDVVIARDGVDLLINIGSAGDQIRVKYWYSGSYYRIESLEFADGTAWDVGTLESAGLLLEGTEASDTLTGTHNKSDRIYGYGGDDTISGLSGSDYLYGGSGDDLLKGGGGNDFLYGEEGNDTLKADGSGNSTLDGGTGNDTLVGYYNGNNTLLGGDGDDVLKLDSERSGSQYRSNTFEGGTGNDTLTGSASSDTYIFNLGDGQDVISDYDIGSGKQDKIVLGESLDHDNLWFTQSGNDLVIDHIGSDDRITVKNWYSSSNYRIEIIEASDEVLMSNSVNQLVQAMVAISSGEPGSVDDLTAQQQDDLSSAIAAAWQTS